METINRVSRRCLFLGVIFLAFGCANDLAAFRVADNAPGQPRETSIWASHTGTNSARFSKLEQITPTNVRNLKPAWVFQTGDVADFFQVTPIISEGRLILCTPHNNVLALDPLTGAKLWAFDAQVPIVPYPNKANCRGLAQWQAVPEFGGEATKACDSRLFMATNTGQLLALDPESGALCRDFGDEGKVDLLAGVGDLFWQQEYQVTSPPAVVGDVVVVGSAVADNVRTNAPSGVVRGFDARSGALVWAFDLAPPDFDYERGPVSDAGYALGTPNVWAGMAVDEERDMVFLPTGNPSPDYYRGGELDMAYYGSAVLALRGSTGELLWRFKVVNRDFWDFDVPSIPSLAEITIGGSVVPALIQSTKMGFVFVLHRETGVPLHPVEQRPVPRYGPLAAQLAPTQPFPPEAFRVSRTYEAGASPLGLCNGVEADAQIGEIYTPITEQWTIGLPSIAGATNWGGIAVDASRSLIALHANHVAFTTRLLETEGAQEHFDTLVQPGREGEEYKAALAAIRAYFELPPEANVGLNLGQDYAMARHQLMDPLLGIWPCAGPPFGEVMVIDANAGEVLWRRPHGSVFGSQSLGLPQVGGPLLTETGVLFLGAAMDPTLYAYDLTNGEIIWRHGLPKPANASPMSYWVIDEQGRHRQMVVVAAGGDTRLPFGGSGDYLVAFSLPVP